MSKIKISDLNSMNLCLNQAQTKSIIGGAVVRFPLPLLCITCWSDDVMRDLFPAISSLS